MGCDLLVLATQLLHRSFQLQGSLRDPSFQFGGRLSLYPVSLAQVLFRTFVAGQIVQHPGEPTELA